MLMERDFVAIQAAAFQPEIQGFCCEYDFPEVQSLALFLEAKWWMRSWA